jgi:hypothetical protein
VQLADDADEVALGSRAQPPVTPDGPGDARRRRLLAGEQVVRAHAELAAESDKQLQGGHRVATLDARNVLVGDAQLDRKLLLGELESRPLGADATRDLDFRWLLHAGKPPSEARR